MTHSRACPRCREPLEPLSLGSGSAGGCRRCLGLWLDEAAYSELRERHYATIAARSPAAEPRASVHDRTAPLDCPECNKPMKRTRLAHIDVDACIGHGTWFDRDEIGQVARAIALAHAGVDTEGHEITPELEERLARWDSSVTTSAIDGAAFHAPSGGETLEQYLASRAREASRKPRILCCPNCSAGLPPEAHGRWVCKYCNATLEI